MGHPSLRRWLRSPGERYRLKSSHTSAFSALVDQEPHSSLTHYRRRIFFRMSCTDQTTAVSFGMTWTYWIRLLTSESVLLTYAFIGYIAISDRLQPSCSVDQVPAFSVSDIMYPSAQTCAVTMDEHVRAFKFLSSFSDAGTVESFAYIASNRPQVSILHGPRPPDVTGRVFLLTSPRAPPVRFLQLT